MSETQRSCTRCGVVKPIAEFRPCEGGHRRTCTPCNNEEARERRAARAAATDLTPETATQLIGWAVGDTETALQELIAHGSLATAAESLGWEPARLRRMFAELQRNAARRGFSPADDMTKTVPDGFHVKGVSTMYDADGNVRGQWVKSQRDPEHRIELMMDAVASIAEPFRGLSDPVPVGDTHDADLMAAYIMGDPHVGMFAWARETGDDFDTKIAERDLVTAVDHLVEIAPPAKQAIIVNLGDFYHGDNSMNRTARSGNALDIDTRYSKVLAIGVRIMRRMIDRALEKHEHVKVITEIGNHDDHSALMLALCLSNYYEREPRVEIDTSPAKFHWHRFGSNLIGVTHGDTVKPDKLPGVMASDRAQDWGETEHRIWYTGHVHHDSVKDYPGVSVETFRTLAPKDAWHSAAGYRSAQDMKCDVWHRDWGRVNRHVVGIKQVRAKQR